MRMISFRSFAMEALKLKDEEQDKSGNLNIDGDDSLDESS